MKRLGNDISQDVKEKSIPTDVTTDEKEGEQSQSVSEAYQTALAAGYDPNDPSTYQIAYNYGLFQQYPAPYFAAAAAPAYGSINSPLPPQSPTFTPQGAAYYSPGSPTPVYYAQSAPQTPPTGPVMHSPSLQPFGYPQAYQPNMPTPSSFQVSSAPSSPPQQARYLGSPPLSPPQHHPMWNLPSNRRHTIQFPHHSVHINQPLGQRTPGLNFSGFSPQILNNIYIRGLPPTMTDENLYSMCAVYGTISSSKAMIDQQTGDCKGFGFVMYETKEEAEHAIEALSQMGFQVSFARDSFSIRLKSLQDHSSTNVYLSNLPVDMDEAKLEQLLLPYKTTSTKIMRDPATNVSRGVGFARMVDRQSAEAIIQKFNGITFQGSSAPLQARFADSTAQKKLKDQVVKRRMWKTPQYGVGFGRVMTQPLTPETILSIGTSSNIPMGYYGQIPSYTHGSIRPQDPQSYQNTSLESPEDSELASLAQQKMTIREEDEKNTA
ncbi:uncharacterized protein VTP21DRAFT_3719 [Calcarisporiella thermophila]|uniref:uncharacterized protein n=1 Tax=Calcarisporiella thermophila TaxID=911321 RepID=UPI003743A842